MEAYGLVNCSFYPKEINFFICEFFTIFGHQNPGSGLDPDRYQPKMLDPDPYQMNTDPKHWLAGRQCKHFHLIFKGTYSRDLISHTQTDRLTYSENRARVGKLADGLSARRRRPGHRRYGEHRRHHILRRRHAWTAAPGVRHPARTFLASAASRGSRSAGKCVTWGRQSSGPLVCASTGAPTSYQPVVYLISSYLLPSFPPLAVSPSGGGGRPADLEGREREQTCGDGLSLSCAGYFWKLRNIFHIPLLFPGQIFHHYFSLLDGRGTCS